MKFGRAIIIPAILALSVAGTVLTGAVPAAAPVAMHYHGNPVAPLTSLTYYHG